MDSENKMMRVSLDGVGEYEVSHNDVTWNGFGVPGFTLDQVRELAADLNRFALTVGFDESAMIDVTDGGVVTVHTVELHGKTVKFLEEQVTPDPRDGLYYVGGWQWAWEIIDE